MQAATLSNGAQLSISRASRGGFYREVIIIGRRILINMLFFRLWMKMLCYARVSCKASYKLGVSCRIIVCAVYPEVLLQRCQTSIKIHERSLHWLRTEGNTSAQQNGNETKSEYIWKGDLRKHRRRMAIVTRRSNVYLSPTSRRSGVWRASAERVGGKWSACQKVYVGLLTLISKTVPISVRSLEWKSTK